MDVNWTIYKDKKFLITGGLGFVGVNLIMELLSHGIKPIIFDDGSTNKEQLRLLDIYSETFTVIRNRKNKGTKRQIINIWKDSIENDNNDYCIRNSVVHPWH